MAAAQKTSHVRSTRSDIWSVMVELSSVNDRLRELQPRTLVGVVIFARAATLHAAMYDAVDSWRAADIADIAVAALVRITGGAA